jgi:hypothetical protein
MKKNILNRGLIVAVICTSLSCQQPKVNKVSAQKAANSAKCVGIAAGELIVPGKSVGKFAINGNADSAAVLLGKPDFSDGAMGSALMTWYVKHDTAGYKTSIFADHNFGAKDEAVAHIRKILVTSPNYKTVEGLNTGLPLSDYQKHFDLKPISAYKAKGKRVRVYEAKDKGIAFEIDSASNKGIAIVVHQPKDSLATYINLH